MPDQITLLIDPSQDAAMCRITAAMQCDWSHHSDTLQLRNRGVGASNFAENKGCDIAGNAASLAPRCEERFVAKWYCQLAYNQCAECITLQRVGVDGGSAAALSGRWCGAGHWTSPYSSTPSTVQPTPMDSVRHQPAACSHQASGRCCTRCVDSVLLLQGALSGVVYACITPWVLLHRRRACGGPHR